MVRRALGAPAWCFCSLLAFVWSMHPSPAQASCLASDDPAIRELQTLVDQDAARAVKRVQTIVGPLEHESAPDVNRLASLYAVQARAYSILELDEGARIAALKGLKLATAASDPVHLDLLTTYAENIYDPAAIDAALKSVEAAQAAQVRGSIADICLLITRGRLQYRQDRPDLAIGSLTQAYRASTAPEYAEPRIIAASILSTVMRTAGDYTQALALNQEVIDWATPRGATLTLSVNRFLRGKIFNLMGQYAAAIEEYTEARKLSAQVNDTQGLGFADLFDCSARIELGQLDRAAADCGNALRTFSASHTADQVKEAQGLLASIDLANGHADKALKTLNEVLDHGGADLLPGRVAQLYQWRARANAALHNYRDAYADLAEYARRYAASNDAERTSAAVAMRARFETDQEIERNALLKRELGISREQSQRQARELRWNALVVTLGVVVIALLIYFLIVNRRYRQQLVKLASQDSLTGLPNRRCTAELATAALEEATATQSPLTIAIIDLDHFKIINDRCGHAAGDFVLKEFARVGRDALRESDVLGRWGGEEFLLVMPGANLESAMASLERMRTLVFGIHLPASGAGLRVSLSAGVATIQKHGRSLDEMIARADSALYAAKNQGRDLVRVADENFLSTTAIRRAIRL
ncbi:MAG TPA: GGDEF domain-containing protein [Steroidobacteraceae bacterium]|nr:GGDEF domain-containing protein [Steroidobacteraceae bacterium]